MQLPAFDDIQKAHSRIKAYIHQTPVLTSSFLDRLTGAELFFKCENLQKTGAFKARGACNAVFSLSDQEAAKGVCSHSSGNHAAALSYAAGIRGIPCHIVMPETAPDVKKAAVRDYGGHITECAASASAREQAVTKIRQETGSEYVHPYNDARVIAGQGTCAIELLAQTGGVDIIVPPIGGGGLVSGTCLTAAAIAPQTKVIAGEPANADDAYRSFTSGTLVTEDAPQTIADGLKAPLKDMTWAIVQRHVSDILTVTEQEIIDAMKLIWQRMKIIVEPSCAVPLAAIIKNKARFAGKRVGVILTGGNTNLDQLPWQN